MSESIITLDVGGKILKTHISTLTKDPESMLGAMFNHTDQEIGKFKFLFQIPPLDGDYLKVSLDCTVSTSSG